MKESSPCILALNGGSSSIRFALYDAANKPIQRYRGKLDRIGLRGSTLSIESSRSAEAVQRVIVPTLRVAVGFLMKWVEAHIDRSSLKAVGHRVVHGLKHSAPERVTDKLLGQLRRLTSFAPAHLPRELELIEAVSQHYPGVPQLACFDTAFHRSMPTVAKRLAIPRRYEAMGVQRYGFHGLSYAYLLEELGRLDPPARKGRIIFAHLGAGASLAAVRDGHSIDTSMGFTPASGLVMSSRSGDLDPGLVYYLARATNMTPAKFEKMVNQESGLLGVSGRSSDLRDLTARSGFDSRAREAVDLFCYQAMKWIGAFAAALGGLDTLVFSAGIGENSPTIRNRICERLGFLGVRIDSRRNTNNSPLISQNGGRVTVRIIPTNEELMIARYVMRTLDVH